MKGSLPKEIHDQFVKSYEFYLNYKGGEDLTESDKISLKEALDTKLRFWEIADDQELESFLFDSLAEIAYCLTDESLESLPKPYLSLILVMEFELTTQSGGWVALSNHGNDRMIIIAEAYREVGLPEVAKGLIAATQALTSDLNPGTQEFQDVLSAAYAQHVKVKHDFDGDFETRMPYIISYARQIPSITS